MLKNTLTAKWNHLLRQNATLQLTRPFSQARIPKNHNLLGFIQHYQRNGHLRSKIDPLGLRNPDFIEASTFETDHWQLNELETISSYPLDYRVSDNLIESPPNPFNGLKSQ